MKIKKILSVSIAVMLIAGITLTGCGKKEEVLSESTTFPNQVSEKIMEESTNTVPEEPINDVAADTAESTAEDAETKSLTITALNFTNISIGMFSVIDPATNEQINVAGMEPGESISLECNWPVDTDSFQWALYNQAGELCIDASTEIKEAKKTVALAITGDTTVENVEVGME